MVYVEWLVIMRKTRQLLTKLTDYIGNSTPLKMLRSRCCFDDVCTILLTLDSFATFMYIALNFIYQLSLSC